MVLAHQMDALWVMNGRGRVRTGPEWYACRCCRSCRDGAGRVGDGAADRIRRMERRLTSSPASANALHHVQSNGVRSTARKIFFPCGQQAPAAYSDLTKAV